jgi:small subunit ribosomal protein S20
MPITLSAKKKMHQDVARREVNLRVLGTMKKAIRLMKLTPTDKNLKTASSAIDTAMKKKIIHKNKAARLKSQLAKKIKKSSAKPKSEIKK